MAKKDNYVRKGGASFPTLFTTKEFAHHIGKREEWVRRACRDGVIRACQKVGGNWVIAEDTLLAPRALKGMPGDLIDFDLPVERIIGRTYVVAPPEYKGKGKSNPHGNKRRKITLLGWPRIRDETGLSKNKIYEKTGVHHFTQKKLDNLEPVVSEVAWRLAYYFDVEIEDLLRK
jgi:hypothetical protein